MGKRRTKKKCLGERGGQRDEKVEKRLGKRTLHYKLIEAIYQYLVQFLALREGNAYSMDE